MKVTVLYFVVCDTGKRRRAESPNQQHAAGCGLSPHAGLGRKSHQCQGRFQRRCRSNGAPPSSTHHSAAPSPDPPTAPSTQHFLSLSNQHEACLQWKKLVGSVPEKNNKFRQDPARRPAAGTSEKRILTQKWMCSSVNESHRFLYDTDPLSSESVSVRGSELQPAVLSHQSWCLTTATAWNLSEPESTVGIGVNPSDPESQSREPHGNWFWVSWLFHPLTADVFWDVFLIVSLGLLDIKQLPGRGSNSRPPDHDARPSAPYETCEYETEVLTTYRSIPYACDEVVSSVTHWDQTRSVLLYLGVFMTAFCSTQDHLSFSCRYGCRKMHRWHSVNAKKAIWFAHR